MISELSPQLSQANFLLPLGLLLQNGSAAELESSSSSEDEDEVEPKTMTEKMVMRELRVTVNKLKCSTDRITDHDSGSSACNDIKEDVVPFSSAYSDIQIVYNSGDKTGRSSIEPEVVNLSSASSRSISSQASHWTAPEIKETDMELDRLPKLQNRSATAQFCRSLNSDSVVLYIQLYTPTVQLYTGASVLWLG